MTQPAIRSRREAAAGIITICGGLLAVLSAFQPWMSIHIALVSLNRTAFQLGPTLGHSLDGFVLLVFGLLGICMGASHVARAELPAFLRRSPIGLGIAIALVPAFRLGRVHHYAQTIKAAFSWATVSIGFGLWLALVAAAVTVVGGLALLSRQREA